MALDYYRSQGKIQGHAITNLQIKLLLVKLLLINNPHGKTIKYTNLIG
jgi:hypothetical protein